MLHAGGRAGGHDHDGERAGMIMTVSGERLHALLCSLRYSTPRGGFLCSSARAAAAAAVGQGRWAGDAQDLSCAGMAHRASRHNDGADDIHHEAGHVAQRQVREDTLLLLLRAGRQHQHQHQRVVERGGSSNPRSSAPYVRGEGALCPTTVVSTRDQPASTARWGLRRLLKPSYGLPG